MRETTADAIFFWEFRIECRHFLVSTSKNRYALRYFLCRVLPRAQREAVEVWDPRLCQFGVPKDSRLRNHCVLCCLGRQVRWAVRQSCRQGLGMASVAEVAASLERMACLEPLWAQRRELYCSVVISFHWQSNPRQHSWWVFHL